MSDRRNVPQAAMEALLRGDKMEAIKLIREATGGDLRSAMEMVQGVAAQLQQVKQAQRSGSHSGPHHQPETSGQRENRERTESLMSKAHPPTVMPGDRGGFGLAIWLVILVFAGFVWWMIRG
jgi:hypothetical protein